MISPQVEPAIGVEDYGDADNQNPVLPAASDRNVVPPPPARCWTDPGLVQPYQFGDRIFSDDVRAEFEFLARRCVATKNGYRVRDRNGVWEDHSRKETAHAALCQLYRGQQDGHAITVELISRFLSPTNGGQVLFNGQVVLPGMPEFVVMSSGKLVNTWREARLSGRRDCIDDAEIILRILRENLCNLDRVSTKQMIDEANGVHPTLFKWVLHWLASVYTLPGRHIGTALWFLGQNHGVGKATLVAILRALLGELFCTKADKTELDRGWNSFVSGALLIEADEFENGSRKDMNDFMKLMLGNPLVSIAHRNLGAFVCPNVANWLFTTNRPSPIEIERHDRRHTLVRTTDDRTRNTLADAYWELPPEKRLRALQGFAAILSDIHVDQAFIRKAFMTDHKLDLITENTGAVERWFAATDGEWVVGECHSSADLWAKFRDWASTTDPHCTVRTQNAFGFKMVELESHGYVSRDRTNKGSRYTKTHYYFDETQARVESAAQTKKVVDRMYARAGSPIVASNGATTSTSWLDSL